MTSTFLAERIVAVSSSHIPEITTKAKAIWCKRKKTGVHAKFKKNCAAKSFILLESPRLMSRPSEIPIMIYRQTQTGPKTHGGGFPGALFKSAYQPSPRGVANPELSPKMRQTTAPITGHFQEGLALLSFSAFISPDSSSLKMVL